MELKWSEEAMAAINTHLCLLQKGRRAAFLEEEEEEASDHDHGYHDDYEPNASSKRMRMTATDEGGGRFCSGEDDSIISREDNNAGAAANIIDLASQLPLPLGWEQFLDLRSGQVYYIDWKSCRRSYDDPRKVFHETPSSSQSCVIPSLRWELNYKPSSEHELSDISSECNSGTVCNESLMGSNTDQKHAKAMIKQEVSISIATSPLLDEDWELMKSRGWLPLMGTDDDHSEISSASINEANSVAVKREASVKKLEGDEESEAEKEQGLDDDCDDDNNDDGNLGENRELHDDVPYLLSSPSSSLCAHCGFVYVRRDI